MKIVNTVLVDAALSFVGAVSAPGARADDHYSLPVESVLVQSHGARPFVLSRLRVSAKQTLPILTVSSS